jgi:pimeloyl-ACP methyl ester carboxylesterase
LIHPWPATVGQTLRHREGTGTPLVLVHGFSMCAETWLPILPLLTEHHDVLVLTLHGHFRGAPVPAGEPVDVVSTLDRLEVDLDAAGVSTAHLVGNSLGGWLAAELARRGRARSLTALSPAGGWELGSAEARRIGGRLSRSGRLLHLLAPRLDRLTRAAAFRRYALADLIADGGRHTTAEQSLLLLRSALGCEVYERVLAAAATQGPPAPFHDLAIPARLVWGEVDRLLPSPRYSRRWRRVLPGADWVTLPGVGHVPTYDDPPALARAILDHTGQADAA